MTLIDYMRPIRRPLTIARYYRHLDARSGTKIVSELYQGDFAGLPQRQSTAVQACHAEAYASSWLIYRMDEEKQRLLDAVEFSWYWYWWGGGN